MDASEVGRFTKPLDAIHIVGYFAPEMVRRLVAAGLDDGRMSYFASRSAAMGAVSPEVVAATFYNFNPDLVAEFLPRAWELVDPAAIVAARYEAIDEILRRALGDELIGSADVAESAELVAIAAQAARPDGRPLFAAHAAVPWPEQPHLSLWHGLTLLREYRGDGHVAALQVVGLSGIEALITHTATGKGFTSKFARTRRAWSQEQWDEASGDLTDRGLLEGGKLTDLGVEVRQAAEDLTDDLAFAPWSELGDPGLARLAETIAPVHAAVIESGAIPKEPFAPGWVGPDFYAPSSA